MIRPNPSDLKNFPESNVFSEGIRVLPAEQRQRSCEVHFGVKYAEKEGLDLHLHIIEPRCEEGEDTTFPIVMFVQGSGWMKQKTGLEIAQLSRFASRGFVIAVVEYRPSSVSPFPAQIADTKTAIRYMVRHAKEYNGNPRDMIVWGDSSGGHTTVMTGLTVTSGEWDDGKNTGEPLSVKAVVDYYGPSDISKMNDEPSTMDHNAADSPEGMLLGGVEVLENMDRVHPTIPMNLIDAHRAIPPILIMHGSRDRLVPFGQSVMLFDALKKAGKEVDFYQLQGADHGGSAFWTGNVLDIVEDFIRRRL